MHIELWCVSAEIWASQLDHNCPLLLFLWLKDELKVLWGPELDAFARTGNS